MIHDARVIHLDGRPHPFPKKSDTGRVIRSAAGTPWWSTPRTSTTAADLWGRRRQLRVGSPCPHDRAAQFLRRRHSAVPVEIDNPTAFTRPWKGELTLTRSADRIYEFACHEANYSLTNMLRGYRALERKP